jgi:hypothetical protein
VLAGSGEASRVKDISVRSLETVADLVAWAASRAKGLRRIA